MKKLTLKGFKSFAEPASIMLEPGVTVVVGPNGSGKSNIVDAVAWVLGAQAPSAVRSGRMDDVIFAGTSAKSPMGRAEVSLIIDNSDGGLLVDFPEICITRTLFRSGESSYALNGAPCRLLDIAELLSDTGVGRRQHLIVSQNQIDAVLNVRSGDRRAVVEEAAGVLKFRRRRERAERRLAGTDADLVRIRDLRREVRRQLRPLARQADAARRHAGLVSELKTLRVYLAGQKIANLRASLRRHAAESGTRAQASDTLQAELDALRNETESCERRLTRHGGDGSTKSLARWEAVSERARGLAALAAERRRGLRQELAAAQDRSLFVALRAEADRVRRELSVVAAEEAEARRAGSVLNDEKARWEAAQASFVAKWQSGQPVVSATVALNSLPLSAGTAAGKAQSAATAAAEARGEIAALRRSISTSEAERKRLRERISVAQQRAASAEAEADVQRRRLARLSLQTESLRQTSAAANASMRSAKARLDAAVQVLSDAQAERNRWTARCEALRIGVRDDTAPSEELESVDGVVGRLADLLHVQDGFEAAVAAAAQDALSAVVARDTGAAAGVLRRLEASQTGAVVIALDGILAVESPDIEPSLEPLRARVAPDAGSADAEPVERLLDLLLGSTVIAEGDWRAAAEISERHPGLVVVTRAGDRLSSRGWCLGVHAVAGAVAALHEAERRAAAAASAAQEASAGRDRASAALTERTSAAAEARSRLRKTEQAETAAATALSRAEADERAIAGAVDLLRDRLDDVSVRLEGDRIRLSSLEAELPAMLAAAKAERERERLMTAERSRLDRLAASLNARLAEASAVEAGLSQRRRMLEERKAEFHSVLARCEADQADADRRIAALRRRDAVLGALHQAISSRSVTIRAGLSAVRERSRRWSERARALAARLDGLRLQSSQTQQRLEELRRESAEADIVHTELRIRLQEAVERLRADHQIAPAEAVEAECPQLAPGEDPAERAEQLASELRIIGSVNPLALDEFKELNDRHELLREQHDDILAARRHLHTVIRSINREIAAVFGAAFSDVAANFETLFEALFPGGEGRLTLTDPADLLNTGIEVHARPSGKRVRRLSLLSGGERTLAAVAFLFAVFRSRPSPFYVLDEAEASLDDVNLQRFLVLVDEFRADAQLVIVTHQKRTMEAADYLYGVSMRPGGSSMVVSERITEAA